MTMLYLLPEPIPEQDLFDAVADIESIAAAGARECSLAKVPGDNNWIEKSSLGHLPNYICRVAKAMHQRRGMPLGKAIQMAIGVIRDWARGGRNVNADTRAKAAAAIAEWEAMKAEARTRRTRRG
jgi:hypothetical protein